MQETMHTWVTSLFPIIKRQTKHNSHKAPVKNIELLPFMQTRQCSINKACRAKQECLI